MFVEVEKASNLSYHPRRICSPTSNLCLFDSNFVKTFASIVPSSLRPLISLSLRTFILSYLLVIVPSALRPLVLTFIRAFGPSSLRSCVPSFLQPFFPFVPALLCPLVPSCLRPFLPFVPAFLCPLVPSFPSSFRLISCSIVISFLCTLYAFFRISPFTRLSYLL